MAAKAKLTNDQRHRIAEVLAARRALPTDKELAREFGVSVAAIRWTMKQLLEAVAWERGRHALSKMLGSTGNNSGRLPTCPLPARSVTLSASE